MPTLAPPKSVHMSQVDVEAGGNSILHDVSLRLHPGELCALVGPSGAGKSTLIKVLLGIRSPTRGEVRFGGKPVQEQGPVGYVPQDDALHVTLTVEQELQFAARLRLQGAAPARQRAQVETVLGQVGLRERKHVRVAKLSGGQRKRVSVALELLTEPDLLILDEPTSGLDPGLEARMMTLFRSVAGKGRCVLVATHSMESLGLCDALLLLVRGRVAFFGLPSDALAHFRCERFADIFRVLEQRDAEAWAKQFAASPLRGQFMQRPAKLPRESPPPEPSVEGGSSPSVDDQALTALKARVAGHST